MSARCLFLSLAAALLTVPATANSTNHNRTAPSNSVGLPGTARPADDLRSQLRDPIDFSIRVPADQPLTPALRAKIQDLLTDLEELERLCPSCSDIGGGTTGGTPGTGLTTGGGTTGTTGTAPSGPCPEGYIWNQVLLRCMRPLEN